MATPYAMTLLDIVQSVNGYARSEDEVVATVTYLINSGKVRLCGAFTGAKIDLRAPPTALRQHPAELADLAPTFLLAARSRSRGSAGSPT